MKKNLLCGALALTTGLAYSNQLITTSSQSAHLTSIFSVLKQGHVLAQAGGYWSNQGKTQHINIEGLIGDDFTVTQHNGSNGVVGLGYYIDSQRFERFHLSYGLNGFYLPKAYVAGDVVQESLFTNLSYRYDTTNYPVYLVAKSIIPLPEKQSALTVDVGIGPNWMHTEGFAESSLDGGITIPDNAFAGRTTTTFSVTVGAGIQLANVFGKAPLECGYRFFYLGQGRFDRKTEQLIDTLHTGDAYANAVLCAVRI
ncbi:hypothetical protein [Legionella fallonii]|uniref:Outer membrane protein beta-barrel domain-containing protein n=1 Tax=Legionella fallonii LLAP-10 TaxID=1212491 RepID=A0A098G6J5_9GAMM|nr:hypothetical protein [Legionella fallonii]CEG57135.1 conserved exported protein of unknown function [Legionella fallonii LLAP-10]